MKKINKLWNQTLNVLNLDHIGFVSSHQSQSFQTCLSCKFIIKSICKNCNNGVDIVLLETSCVWDFNKLGHWVNAVLLNLLVDVLLLELFHDASVELLYYILVLSFQDTVRVLKLNNEFTWDKKALCNDFRLGCGHCFDQKLADLSALLLCNFWCFWRVFIFEGMLQNLKWVQNKIIITLLCALANILKNFSKVILKIFLHQRSQNLQSLHDLNLDLKILRPILFK